MDQSGDEDAAKRAAASPEASRIGALDILKGALRVLEQLYNGREWFEKAQYPDHAAYQRWQLLRRILRQGGHLGTFRETVDAMPILSRVLLDNLTLSKIGGRRFADFQLGDIAGYGDHAVQQKLRSQIAKPGQFEDVMVELATAAWHLELGHRVIPIEEEGQPDFRIEGMMAMPLPIECKNLTTSNPKRIGRLVWHANHQIRACEPSTVGGLVIDVSQAVGLLPNTDTPHASVIAIARHVKRALSGAKNRAVARAEIVWNEYSVLSRPEESDAPDSGCFVFVRKVLRVDHSPEPGLVLLPASLRLAGEGTVYWEATWEPFFASIREVKLASGVLEASALLSLTPDDIADCIRFCERTETLQFEDHPPIYLFYRPGDHQILVGATREDTALTVQFALRARDAVFVQGTASPLREMLCNIVEKAGYKIELAGERARLLLDCRLPLAAKQSPVITVDADGDAPVISFFALRTLQFGGLGFVECALAFAIDPRQLISINT